jgi:CheY-like chemotaxis protein
VGELRLDDLRHFVERTFRHVAEQKSVDFTIDFDKHLPEAMLTDAKRLQQIIKNLLSNAFKFTHRGSVSLSVHPVLEGWNGDNEDLNRSNYVLAFEVSDTGIGISADKQQIIFEAFQQADGSTSRKYGGTGLGLAISRELSRLLGGEIKLVSSPGMGSTFTLYIPHTYSPPRTPRKSLPSEPSAVALSAAGISTTEPRQRANQPVALSRASAAPKKREKRAKGAAEHVPEPQPDDLALVNEANDDRNNIQQGDRVILIVENDVGFARFLLDAAREQGMKGLVTSLGASALALAREYNPHAVTLDIFLPDIEGWRVLERLKSNLATRHLPVCVISTDDARRRALASGAIAFLAKPIQSREVLDDMLRYLNDFVSRSTRQVLVVEPDADRRQEIVSLVASEDVKVEAVNDDEQAVAVLATAKPDCIVVNPALTGLAERLAGNGDSSGNGHSRPQLPVIVYGRKEKEDAAWNRLGDSVTLRKAESPDRLLDLTMLFTHRTVRELAEEKRQMLINLHDSDRILAGKKVLIVDDDVRNIFALTTVLEEHAMRTLPADNGRDAIKILQNEEGIDIVLMDIMMPEMDGMETIRQIRRDPKLKNLPIVAVTAKAMKGDREKCIEAGAWGYLSKPVDTEQLLAVLRDWLRESVTNSVQ